MKERQALLLICDDAWVVTDALSMSDGHVMVEHVIIGKGLGDLIPKQSHTNMGLIISKLGNGDIVSSVEMELDLQGSRTSMQFFGCKVEDHHILGAGTDPEEMLTLIIDPFVRSDPGRNAILHKFVMAFLMQTKMNTIESRVFDDISRMNNEIINTSRELNKRNFELFLEKERNRVTIASIGDAVVTTDVHGKITLMNSIAEQLTGWSNQEGISKDVTDVVRFVNGSDASSLQHLFRTSLAESINYTLPFDAKLIRRDGTTIHVDDSIAPIKDTSGKTLGLVIIFRDITERKRMEDAILKANSKLSILNSITRHDILNQMTALNGFLELSKMIEKDSKIASYLDRISQATFNIQKQINFTKDYQDMGIKEPAWVSIGHQTVDAFAMLHPYGITMEDATDGVEILTDQLVEKVPYNLIDNSIRHGERVTHIKISAEIFGEALSIVYEDDGVGISAMDRERLFEKGFGKNTGLGLFLIREILAITNITIVENGRSGQGVRFEIMVPPGEWRRP